MKYSEDRWLPKNPKRQKNHQKTKVLWLTISKITDLGILFLQCFTNLLNGLAKAKWLRDFAKNTSGSVLGAAHIVAEAVLTLFCGLACCLEFLFNRAGITPLIWWKGIIESLCKFDTYCRERSIKNTYNYLHRRKNLKHQRSMDFQVTQLQCCCSKFHVTCTMQDTGLTQKESWKHTSYDVRNVFYVTWRIEYKQQASTKWERDKTDAVKQLSKHASQHLKLRCRFRVLNLLHCVHFVSFSSPARDKMYRNFFFRSLLVTILLFCNY